MTGAFLNLAHGVNKSITVWDFLMLEKVLEEEKIMEVRIVGSNY